MSELKLPGSVEFKVTHRDFMSDDKTGGHPDFEYAISSTRGIVGAACTSSNSATCGRLDNDGKPQLKILTRSATAIKNADTFKLWYRDINANHIKDEKGTTDIAIQSIPKTLTLAQSAAGSQDYVLNSTSFFPLDGIDSPETMTSGSLSMDAWQWILVECMA